MGEKNLRNQEMQQPIPHLQKNQVSLVIFAISVAMLIINLWFFQSFWIGLPFFIIYAFFASTAVARHLGLSERLLAIPFGFLLLNMLFLSVTAVAIRLFIPLSNVLLTILVHVPFLFFIKKGDDDKTEESISEESSTTITPHTNPSSPGKWSINPVILLVFSLSILGMILALWVSRTGETIPSFHATLNPLYYIFCFTAAVTMMGVILSRHSLQIKLVFLIVFSLASHIFRYIIYVIMTGSDMWSYLIGSWWIYNGGVLPPHSSLYHYIASSENGYLGIWGFNVFISRVTSVNLYFGYPYIGLLLSFFAPLILYQITKSLLTNDTYALFVATLSAFLYSTFMWLSLSSANGLGVLAMLFSLLVWITYLKDSSASIFFPILVTIAGIIAYPLTGMFVACIALISISLRVGLRKGVVALAAVLALILPSFLLVGAIVQFLASGMPPPLNTLPITTILANIIFPHNDLSNLLDIPYLVIYPLIGIGIVLGRKAINRNVYYLLLTVFAIVLFNEAVGWWAQIRILHRIGDTVIPWFFLIFAGIGLPRFHRSLKTVTPTAVNIRFIRIHRVVESRKLLAIGLCLMFGISTTNHFILAPTTNKFNPSTDLVDAVQFIIQQDPSRNTLILADAYSILLLDVLSQGRWYNLPYLRASTHALELALPIYTSILRYPSTLYSGAQDAKITLTNHLMTYYNYTTNPDTFYFVFDPVLAPYMYSNIASDLTEIISVYLGEPTVFGNVHVYRSHIPTLLWNTTVHDISGNNNDGVAYGPFLNQEFIGKYTTFDGIDDYIEAPFLNLTTEFTVEAWVYFIDGQPLGDYGGLFSMMLDLRVLLINESAAVQMHIGSNTETHLSNTIDLTNAWHHIVACYNGTDVCIYVDQALIYSHEQVGNINISANKTYIGWGSPYSSWYHLQGSLDEFRIYDRALNSTEVSHSYLQSVPMNNTGLILWYSFDDEEERGSINSVIPTPPTIVTEADAGQLLHGRFPQLFCNITLRSIYRKAYTIPVRLSLAPRGILAKLDIHLLIEQENQD